MMMAGAVVSPRWGGWLVGLVLAGGLWLRVADLGAPSFETDEVLHVSAAQHMLAGDAPRLPSGVLYRRAWPYTAMVAQAFRWCGVSEVSARMPSVLCGMLVIGGTYLVGRRWFGFWPALVAAALVAAAPEMVNTSRICRMYSFFQWLYLCGLFACAHGMEWQGLGLRRRLIWVGGGLLFLWASYATHQLTLDAIPAAIVCWGGLAMWRGHSRYRWYLLIAVAAIAAGVGFGLVDLGALWVRANTPTTWTAQARYDYGYYWHQWAAWYPWLWWSFPVAAVWLCSRYRVIGWWTLCQCVVPLLLHALVFDRKSPRYVSHLMPWMALVVAPLLVWLWQQAWTWMHRIDRPAFAWRLRGVGTGLSAMLLVITWLPAVARSVELQRPSSRYQWREVYRALAQEAQQGEAVVVAEPEVAAYYLGRSATHVLNNARLDFRPRMSRRDDGTWIDWFSGLPLVTTLGEFLQVQERYPSGWVVASSESFTVPGVIPPAMTRWIAERCEVWPGFGGVPSAVSVIVYRWRR